MISATHVGKNTTSVRAQNDHFCPRCGIRWIDSSWTYCPSAPCFDCRQILCEQFGIIMRYWRRPRAGELAPCELSTARC